MLITVEETKLQVPRARELRVQKRERLNALNHISADKKNRGSSGRERNEIKAGKIEFSSAVLARQVVCQIDRS